MLIILPLHTVIDNELSDYVCHLLFVLLRVFLQSRKFFCSKAHKERMKFGCHIHCYIIVKLVVTAGYPQVGRYLT